MDFILRFLRMIFYFSKIQSAQFIHRANVLFGVAVRVKVLGVKKDSVHSCVIPALNVDFPVTDHDTFRWV